jgi:hypothetical protein
VFVYGEPIVVPSGADRGLMEERRRSLERALESLTGYAEDIAAGRGPTAPPRAR